MEHLTKREKFICDVLKEALQIHKELEYDNDDYSNGYKTATEETLESTIDLILNIEKYMESDE